MTTPSDVREAAAWFEKPLEHLYEWDCTDFTEREKGRPSWHMGKGRR